MGCMSEKELEISTQIQQLLFGLTRQEARAIVMDVSMALTEEEKTIISSSPFNSANNVSHPFDTYMPTSG